MRIEKYIIAISVIWIVFAIVACGCKSLTGENGVIYKMAQKIEEQEKSEDVIENINNSQQNAASSNNTSTDKTEQTTSKGAEKSTADKSSTSNSSNKSGSQNKNDIASSRDYNGYPNTKYSWWFKRNKEHKQPEAQKEVNLGLYDAFYIDEAVKDTDKEKVIYLTFDCGYENGYTPKMLDILKKHKAIATFFVTKPFIKDEPDLVKRMKKEGHLVGNHTVHHPSMPEKSARDNKLELLECAEYMKEATGYEMDKVMRPPMGEYSERTMRITKDMGYKTIFWSMAYLDYDVNNQPGADYVIEYYKNNHHNGAIPLIHNVSSSNAEALDQVLTFLEGEGYKFGSTLDLGETKKK